MFMGIKLTGFLGESRNNGDCSKGKNGEEFHKSYPVKWVRGN
jgi:hypothetical protein